MTASPIPVTVLAGFLGSGKTTLLNRILGADHGLRLAVLVNDFGAVNIDAELLGATQTAAGRADDIISLPNGCICCTLFTSLISVLKRFDEMPEPPERIVLEASGVSAPGQLEALPSTIYRVKGFVRLAETPDQWTTMQVVGRRALLTAQPSTI